MNNYWTLIDQLYSLEDNTIKYIYKSPDKEIAEVSYINKHDGKDILCVPTQTSCKLGCKFCHLTDLNIPVRSFTATEIFELVAKTNQLLKSELRYLETQNKILLVSYMGSGEPLLNINGVIDSATLIENFFLGFDYDWIRFAVASIIPSEKLFITFTDAVVKSGLDFKFHLSLHSPFSEIRNQLVPAAIDVNKSIELLSEFVKITNLPAEIHYTIMENVNDRDEDANSLISLLKDTNIPVKFLKYSERTAAQDLQPSNNVVRFSSQLEGHNIKTEFYTPPGRDVGASCGQFLTTYYKAPEKKRLDIVSTA